MAELSSFSGYALHQQLMELWKSGKTGILQTELQGYQKSLYLRDGLPVFAASNDPEDKLPQILSQMGYFTEEQYENAVPNFKEELSVGRNLVEIGLITQQELVAGAKQQVFAIFARIINTDEGKAGFEEGSLPQGIVSLPLVMPADLMRAILEMKDKGWIGDHFGSGLDFVCTPNPDNKIDFNKVKVADFAGPTFALIDGERDFNHLVFEAGIDDFDLMKFIYALELLDYISIAGDEEAGEEDSMAFADEEQAYDDEPMPEMDDIADQLKDALITDDQINQLSGFPVPDETIDLDRNNLMSQMPLSMDATMELDKAGIGLEAALANGYEEEDSVFDEQPDQGGFGDEEEEEEEQGLDDLGDMTSDILEQELARMQAPLDDDDELSAFSEEEEESSAYGEEGGEEEESAAGEKKSILPKLALILISTGLVILAGAYSLRFFNKEELPANPEQELAQFPKIPAEALENTTEPTGEQTEAVGDSGDSAAIDAVNGAEQDPAQNDGETAAENNPTEVLSQDQPSEPVPEEKQAGDSQPESDPTPPITADPEPTSSATIKKPETADPPKSSAETRGFNSPIADGWQEKAPRNPDYDMPERKETQEQTVPDQSQAEQVVQQPAQLPDPKTTRPQEQPEQKVQKQEPAKKAPVPDESSPEEKQAEATAKKAEEPVTTSKPAQEQPVKEPGTGIDSGTGLETGRSQLKAGNFAAAASAFAQQARQSEKELKVIALFLACQESSITAAMGRFGNNPDFFILPTSLKGSPCYWVCLGRYQSRLAALKAISELPEEVRAENPEVKKLGDLLGQ